MKSKLLFAGILSVGLLSAEQVLGQVVPGGNET